MQPNSPYTPTPRPKMSFFTAFKTFAGSLVGKVVLGATVFVLISGSAFAFIAMSNDKPGVAEAPSDTPDSSRQTTTDNPVEDEAVPAEEVSTEEEKKSDQQDKPAAEQEKPQGGGAGSGASNGNNNGSGGNSSGGNNNPPAFKANCITVPSACGYPDATNTGVPAGVSLTNSGSMNITQDGTVINARNVSGQIIVRANNVTIRNTRITSSDYYPIDYDGGFTGLLVEDSEIIGTSSIVTAGMSFRNYTARRVEVRGTIDGFKADSNVLIEDSYVHDLKYDAVADTHNDGVQTTGGSNVTLRHNTFKLGGLQGISSVIQIGTEWGGNTNWLVTNNLLDGGGWAINAGAGNASMRFTNNRFTKRSGYGPGVVSGSTWTGNYYDDTGATIQ